MNKFSDLKDINLQEWVSAKLLTTFGLGGRVRFLVEPNTITAVKEVLKRVGELDLPYRILGNGSNVVFPEEDFPGVIIRMGKVLEGENHDREFLDLLPEPLSGTASIYLAGSPLMSLSRKTCSESKSGLEFAAGIPGTVGGAIKMNAGAHGSSMSAIVRGAFMAGRAGLRYASDLGFAYRHSEIPDDEIVVAAVLDLPRGSSPDIQQARQSCLNYRKRTQPLSLPSAGSTFKNPFDAEGQPLESAAVYLEQVGLRGYRKGGIAFSEMHVNWLVRLDQNAKSHQVSDLIELGKQRVFEQFGITLIPEVQLW